MTPSPHNRSQAVVNVLTFDVEDWFHGFGLPPSTWRHLQPRLSVGLLRILDLLDTHRVKATFFILGALVAEWRPILGLIADAGHEIAAHGYWHTPIYRLSPADFARNLGRVLEALRPIANQPIRSYRAPFFSITRRSLWALPILAEAGIVYDSSIFPGHNPRYGIPNTNRFPHVISTGCAQRHPADRSLSSSQPHTDLIECPISMIAVGNVTLPFGGGFYARLLPYGLIRWAVRRLNAGGQPVIFYFHPWELDPDQPRIADGVPALYRFTHYHRLGCTAAKLEALLRDFPFGALSDLPHPSTTVAYTEYVGVPNLLGVRPAIHRSPQRPQILTEEKQ